MPKPTVVSVSEAVQPVVGLLPGGARFRIKRSEERLRFLLDPVDFSQMVFGLLDSMLKFSPPGSFVSVRWWKDFGSGWLEVKDGWNEL